MDIQINWLAVVLAALSSMVVGSIWYSPSVFGKAWMQMTGVKPSGKASDATPSIVITVIVSLITAFVLAHVTFMFNSFYHNSYLLDALATAFLAVARIYSCEIHYA